MWWSRGVIINLIIGQNQVRKRSNHQYAFVNLLRPLSSYWTKASNLKCSQILSFCFSCSRKHGKLFTFKAKRERTVLCNWKTGVCIPSASGISTFLYAQVSLDVNWANQRSCEINDIKKKLSKSYTEKTILKYFVKDILKRKSNRHISYCEALKIITKQQINLKS